MTGPGGIFAFSLTMDPIDHCHTLIDNQRKDYSPHPFRAGGGGLADFHVLGRILVRLPVSDVSQMLDKIDDMRATHADCVSCSAKILAFCEAFTADRLPERCRRDRAAYEELVHNARDPRRDYRGEIARYLVF